MGDTFCVDGCFLHLQAVAVNKQTYYKCAEKNKYNMAMVMSYLSSFVNKILM